MGAKVIKVKPARKMRRSAKSVLNRMTTTLSSRTKTRPEKSPEESDDAASVCIESSNKSDQIPRKRWTSSKSRVQEDTEKPKKEYGEPVFKKGGASYWYVKRIVDHKVDKRKGWQYLVEWYGWEEPTWEPIQNLHGHCDHLLKKYNNKHCLKVDHE